MKIAIMQPYLFPYLGYFQLINAVDKFVIYDDVNFINRGWINRNKILVNNKANLFTIPLQKSSQNKLINEIQLSNSISSREKVLDTIHRSYKKAPRFDEVFKLVSDILFYPENKISGFIYKALLELNKFLNIETQVIESSSEYNNSHLKQERRILDICKKEEAEYYINLMGGMDFYPVKTFMENNIKIKFIKSRVIRYKQFNNNFIDSLSIIDVLMFNSKETVRKYLNEYDLI